VKIYQFSTIKKLVGWGNGSVVDCLPGKLKVVNSTLVPPPKRKELVINVSKHNIKFSVCKSVVITVTVLEYLMSGSCRTRSLSHSRNHG
jgi:hypothetical protein